MPIDSGLDMPVINSVSSHVKDSIYTKSNELQEKFSLELEKFDSIMSKLMNCSARIDKHLQDRGK